VKNPATNRGEGLGRSQGIDGSRGWEDRTEGEMGLSKS